MSSADFTKQGVEENEREEWWSIKGKETKNEGGERWVGVFAGLLLSLMAVSSCAD